MDDSRLRLINPAYLAVLQVLRGLRSAGGRPKVSLRTNVRRVVAQAQAILRRRRENVIEWQPEIARAKRKATARDDEEAPSPGFWPMHHSVATRSSVCLP